MRLCHISIVLSSVLVIIKRRCFLKTRTDFVTNSSSSSFIVGFQDTEDFRTLKKELTSILGNSRKANKYYQYIINNWNEINRDSAIDLFEENREYIEDLVGYEIEDYLRADGCFTWYLHDEEFNKKLNDKMVILFDEFKRKIKDYGTLFELEFEDDDVLDEIVPQLSCCIQQLTYR